MNPADVALLAENAVIGLAVVAAWSLLRQGGGLQVKAPPASPRPQAKDEPAAEVKQIAPGERAAS